MLVNFTKDEWEKVEILKVGLDRLLGYIDTKLHRHMREEQSKKLRRFWGAAFGTRYNFYPVIDGSRLTDAYMRRFTFDETSVEIVEFMKEGLTERAILFYQDAQVECRTFDEAERTAVGILKESIECRLH
jgi:hypothetical protein